MLKSRKNHNLPPGPKGKPFVGCAPELRRDPLGFLEKLVRDYGDVAHFRVGPQPVYHFNHPDHVRQLLVTEHRKLCKTGLMKQARPILGKGLFLSEGEFHRRQRRLVQPAFHRERIAGYAPIMTETAALAAEEWEHGQTCDVLQEMLRITLPVVARSLFNTHIGDNLKDVEAALNVVIPYFDRFLKPTAGLLTKLPLPRNRRFQAAKNYLDRVVTDIISKARRQSSGGGGNVLSILMQARDEEGDGSGMSDAQVRDEVMTLFVAGHETVATALAWTWHCVGGHPHVEKQLHQEIDTVTGGGLPTAADIPHLSYTKKVIAESMRLYPPVWGMSRRNVEPVEIGGYSIPAGTTIGLSQYVTQRDPRFFDRPDEFDPLRWDEDVAKERPKYSYFPFGGGPRLCIGEPFAWMEMVLITATLARQWRFRLGDGCAVPLQPKVTLRPQGGLPMRFEWRSNLTDRAEDAMDAVQAAT